jgi:hypothetical protein
MPVKIRILSASNKHMQRAGYLKLLAHGAARTETSNLNALGATLVDTVTKRQRVSPPYSKSLRDYARIRLTDRIYTENRAAVLANKPTTLEIQDLYLADLTLPSSTGKLGANSRRFYTYLGTALDLLKPGTWSAMTRALLLLHLTPSEEIAAFGTYNEKLNPLRISPEQAAVLLYSFLDNDALILQPLFEQLLARNGSGFDERSAGDLLPAIIRKAATEMRKFALNVEDRERLGVLEKSADNIESWKGKPYTGGGAREESIRPRVEPFCDLGLFSKPDRHRFAYQLTQGFRRLMANWSGLDTDHFLASRFFTTLGGIHEIKLREADDDEARAALQDAGEKLQSTLGYSPILDCSLLAGIRLLFSSSRALEISRSLDLLKAWQKQAPDVVRFTVDRMGAMAYVKFLKPAPQPTPAKA